MGDFLDLANCSRVAQSRAVDSARTATHQKRLSGTCITAGVSRHLNSERSAPATLTAKNVP